MVPYVVGSTVPTSYGMPSGIRTTRSREMTTSSANPFHPHMPITRSPPEKSVTSAPTSMTSPATSPPGAKGNGGLNWYLFSMMSRSGKFTPAARTRMRTSVGPTSGRVVSS